MAHHEQALDRDNLAGSDGVRLGDGAARAALPLLQAFVDQAQHLAFELA